MYLYPQQDSNLQNCDPKSHAYANSTMGAFVEVRVGFEPTYRGFADLDFTYQTPDQLTTMKICRLCRNLVIRFYIRLITQRINPPNRWTN